MNSVEGTPRSLATRLGFGRPRRRAEELNRVQLGLVAALVLVVVGAAVFRFVATFDHGHTYEAEFARADGARVGNEVRVAGIEVGEVTGVRLAGDRIIVTFTANDDVHVGSRSEAEVKVATLVGSYYLELDPRGTGQLPHDRIPLSQTRSPYTLDSIVTDAGTDLAALDGDKVRDALGSLTDAVGSDGARLGEVLDGVTAITGIAAKREDQLTALLGSMRETTAIVKDSREDIFSLIGDTSVLLNELLARRSEIENLLDLTVRLNQLMSAWMDTNAKPVAAAMRNLHTLMTVLKKRDASIRQSLTVLAPTMRYLSAVTGTGPYGMFRVATPLPDNALCAMGAIKGCSG